MNARGFSLIEVMIASVILAFIALATTEAVKQNRDAKDKVDEEIDTYQAIRATFGVIRRDLNNIFHLNKYDLTPYMHVNLASIPKDFQPERYKRITTYVKGTENTLHFTSLSHFRMFTDKPATEQAEISYFTEADKTDSSILHLYKRESPLIDENQKETDAGTSYILLEDLSAFKIRYIDSKEQATTTWDTTTDGSDVFPELIEITLIVNVRHPNSLEAARKMEITTTFKPHFQNNIQNARLGGLPALAQIIDAEREKTAQQNNDPNKGAAGGNLTDPQ